MIVLYHGDYVLPLREKKTKKYTILHTPNHSIFYFTNYQNKKEKKTTKKHN